MRCGLFRADPSRLSVRLVLSLVFTLWVVNPLWAQEPAQQTASGNALDDHVHSDAAEHSHDPHAGLPQGLIQAPSSHLPGAGHQGPDTAADPLSQLREIHTAQPHWWPPAPGWWVLAAVLLFLLYHACAWLWRWLQHRRRYGRIVQQFNLALTAYDDHGDRRRLAMDLDVLLRRLALRRFGHDRAGATGQAWLALWGVADNDALGQVLLQAPYRPNPDYDPAQLHAWVLEKVRRHA